MAAPHSRPPPLLHVALLPAASKYSSQTLGGISMSQATAVVTALKIAGDDNGGLASDSDDGSDDSECRCGRLKNVRLCSTAPGLPVTTALCWRPAQGT